MVASLVCSCLQRGAPDICQDDASFSFTPDNAALQAHRLLPVRLRGYFFGAGFLAEGIAVVGTMMCAYGVPFHITQGPPLVQSVG